MLTRREMMKGLIGAPAMLRFGRLRSPGGLLDGHDQPPSPPTTPFQTRLPIPNAAPKVQDPSIKLAILAQAAAEASRERDTFPAAPLSQGLQDLLLTEADFYDITMMRALQPILPGQMTEIWGYNGLFPGPSIVAMRCRPAVVRFTNQLTTLTESIEAVVHYHGGHTPPPVGWLSERHDRALNL